MKVSENVKYTYDHYYTYEELTTILKGYEEKYPDYVKLDSIGESSEGRNLWLMKITNKATGSFEDKPAYYAEGNIHAGEVTGSMVCMYFLDSLFTNIDDKEIQAFLKDNTLYILPRVSPDGAEVYLTTPTSLRSVNRPYPFGEEQEGLEGCDLDGDGVIRKMRVKSPYGIWKVSEKDPRVMVKRKPDDVEGTFYNIYTEGLIKDYDGVHVKKAPAKYGYDFNRNYTVDWKPEEVQRGSGKYPLCNPETKANADFLLSHSNVCTVLDYHTSGGMYLYTPGYKPSSEAHPADIAVYKAIGQMGKEESGYPLLNVYDEFGAGAKDVTYGGFDDFCHFHVGVPAFTIECWDMARRAGASESFPPKPQSDEEQEENMVKCLKWIDENLDGEGYKDWTPFNHPELGEVEIGGVDFKYVVQNPPKKFLTQELEKHTRFMYREMKTLPKISFDKIKTTKIAEDVYKLECSVLNSGFLASYVFKESLKKTFVKELEVQLSGAQVVEGKEKMKIGHLEGYSGVMGINGLWGPLTFNDEACEKKVSWIVKGKEGSEVTLSVSGGRIGKKSTTLTLK